MSHGNLWYVCPDVTNARSSACERTHSSYSFGDTTSMDLVLVFMDVGILILKVVDSMSHEPLHLMTTIIMKNTYLAANVDRLPRPTFQYRWAWLRTEWHSPLSSLGEKLLYIPEGLKDTKAQLNERLLCVGNWPRILPKIEAELNQKPADCLYGQTALRLDGGGDVILKFQAQALRS